MRDETAQLTHAANLSRLGGVVNLLKLSKTLSEMLLSCAKLSSKPVRLVFRMSRIEHDFDGVRRQWNFAGSTSASGGTFFKALLVNDVTGHSDEWIEEIDDLFMLS